MKENKKKKVLIAMDYDPTAQKIAEEGFSMAKAMNLRPQSISYFESLINQEAVSNYSTKYIGRKHIF